MNHWEYFDRQKELETQIRDLQDEREFMHTRSRVGGRKKREIIRIINQRIHRLAIERSKLEYPGFSYNVSDEVRQQIFNQIFEINVKKANTGANNETEVTNGDTGPGPEP